MDGDPAGKRRFHGPGRSPRHHLGFVVVHVQSFAPVLPVKLLLGHLLPGEAAPRGGT